MPFPSPMHESEVKVKSLSCVRLFETPWTVAYQAINANFHIKVELVFIIVLTKVILHCDYILTHMYDPIWASQGVLVVKNMLANTGDIRDLGLTLGREEPPQEGMATPSSVLAWRIPWTVEPGRLQSVGSQRAGHD